MRRLCCACPTRNRSRRSFSTLKPAITISMWRCSSCATLTSPPKACCPPARIPARRLLWARKASACGPAAAMKRPSPAASITPIPRITCAIRRTPRWICTKRLIPGLTSPRRSTSTASTATNINSSVWPRAAARPTKPICIRKPKR